MVICYRCQRNIAQFECEICNGFYCPECDLFIHSRNPKSNHIRKKVQLYDQKEDFRNIPNIINQNQNNQNRSTINQNTYREYMSWSPQLSNDSIYNNDKLENLKALSISPQEMGEGKDFQLLSQAYQDPSSNKINNINSDINANSNINNNINTKNLKERNNYDDMQMQLQRKQNEFEKIDESKNYNNNINYDKINYIRQNLNNCISDGNFNNINNMDNIDDRDKERELQEKDNEIRQLQRRIEEQREIIDKLKNENRHIEDLIERDRELKDELGKEKERLYAQKRTIEDFYYEKQKEIQKIHDMEKYKLIEDYESQMKEISDNFINNKSDYMRGMQEMEEKMRDCEKNREEVKKNMLIEIDRLKKEGMEAEKEQEYLIRSNDELNNKLRETTSNMDILRANTLKSTKKKKKSTTKNKKKKSIK